MAKKTYSFILKNIMNNTKGNLNPIMTLGSFKINQFYNYPLFSTVLRLDSHV